MMNTRRSLMAFGAALAAVALLAPAAGLAQTGTTDTTDPTTVPQSGTQVTNVRALPFADKFDSLQVAWVEPTVPDAEGPLTGYRIYYAEMTTTTTALGATNLLNAMSQDVGVGVSGTIDGLTPGKTYLVRVAPRNKLGVGSIDATTGDPSGMVTAAPMPDRVTGVMATPGDGMLMIEWMEPFAGHSSLSIKAYHVYVRTSKTDSMKAGDWRDVGPVMTTSATAANLMNGMMYDVEVSAKNSADAVGPRSVTVMATPMAGAMTPTPALPVFGAFALGAGLLAAGRRRLRRRQQLLNS